MEQGNGSADQTVERLEWLGGSLERKDAQLLVGPSFEKYWRRWSAMAAKRSSISWNWSSAFLGLGWLGFRKMNKTAAIALACIAGVFLLIGGTAAETGQPGIPPFLLLITVAVCFVVFGLLGDKFYRDHTAAEIKLAHTVEGTPDARAARLRSLSGPSYPMAAVWVVAAFFGVLGSAAIGISLGSPPPQSAATKPAATPPQTVSRPAPQPSASCQEVASRAPQLQRRIDRLKLDYPVATGWACDRFKQASKGDAADALINFGSWAIGCAFTGAKDACEYASKELMDIGTGITTLQNFARERSCPVPNFSSPCS